MRRLSIAAIAIAVLSLAISGWALWRSYDTADTSKKGPAATTSTTTARSTTSTTGIVAVPSEIGKNAFVAASDLEKVKLKAAVVKAPSVSVAKGRVISQDPSPGTKVPVGTEVKLTISSGPS